MPVSDHPLQVKASSICSRYFPCGEESFTSLVNVENTQQITKCLLVLSMQLAKIMIIITSHPSSHVSFKFYIIPPSLPPLSSSPIFHAHVKIRQRHSSLCFSRDVYQDKTVALVTTDFGQFDLSSLPF